MHIPDKRILIVEDEAKIARYLQLELEHEGYRTSTESNGRRALDRIIQEDFDLVLLDVMLPELDGMEVCRRVRSLSAVPIIMVTAKDSVDSKVEGLDTGADDYLTKPFAIQELFARIRNIFRRNSAGEDSAVAAELCINGLTLFPAQFEVRVDGEIVVLTKKEYDLLDFLVRNKNIVLTRDRILQEVWGYDYIGDTNVVDVYIRYLRSKIDERFGKKYIHTVRGVGYAVKD